MLSFGRYPFDLPEGRQQESFEQQDLRTAFKLLRDNIVAKL